MFHRTPLQLSIEHGIVFTHYAMDILRALRWLLRGLPADGTCDDLEHVRGLPTSDEHILCTKSWLHKLIIHFTTKNPKLCNSR